MNKFAIGDKVVVVLAEDGDDCTNGTIGIVEEDSFAPYVLFKQGERECLSEDQLKHYTPIEDLPLWKANHMYLNEEQKAALAALLHRVQWDEEYAEKIEMNLERQSILFAFDWNETEEGMDYWDEVENQVDVGVAQQQSNASKEDIVEEQSKPNGGSSEYFLQRAIDLQKERGKEYDNGQERSMGKIVDVFNIITKHNLSEAEGWLFMQVLKDVRQWTKPEYHKDSAEDCVSYAALKAEALASGK